ncbi:SDR family oxidoreductase, partial [Mobilicoccus pelagius]
AQTDATMRALGRERARELGWTDVYTMTKSLGERVAEELWAAPGHRLTILRPTIIESALRHPFPGWIDGFKVADPLIAAFAKGRLVAFPGYPEAVLDVVPVDLVVDAILAATHVPHDDALPRYLQVGTSVSNPMTLDTLRGHVEGFLREHPWVDRDGAPIRLRPWRFLDPDALEAWAGRRIDVVDRLGRALDVLPAATLPRARRRVATAARGLGLLRQYAGIYQPYTCSHTRYDDAETRTLLARANAAGFLDALDAREIDWAHYVRAVHMPSLTRTATEHRARREARREAPRGSEGQRPHRRTGHAARTSALLAEA